MSCLAGIPNRMSHIDWCAVGISVGIVVVLWGVVWAIMTVLQKKFRL